MTSTPSRVARELLTAVLNAESCDELMPGAARIARLAERGRFRAASRIARTVVRSALRLAPMVKLYVTDVPDVKVWVDTIGYSVDDDRRVAYRLLWLYLFYPYDIAEGSGSEVEPLAILFADDGSDPEPLAVYTRIHYTVYEWRPRSDDRVEVAVAPVGHTPVPLDATLTDKVGVTDIPRLLWATAVKAGFLLGRRLGLYTSVTVVPDKVDDYAVYKPVVSNDPRLDEMRREVFERASRTLTTLYTPVKMYNIASMV